MLKRSLSRTLFVMLAVAVAPSVFAQTSIDIHNGTVVGVWDNTLVINDGATSRQFDVAPNFTVDVDGRQVGVKDLRPGMHITAVVKTTSTPVVVQTTELRNAQYIKHAGAIVYTKETDGVHQYTVPSGFRFWIGGNPLRVDDLQTGTMLNATIVHTGKGTGTSQQLTNAAASDPAAKAAADKAAADKAAADAAARKAAADKAAADKAAAKAAADAEAAKMASKKLPKTASVVPMAGVAGLLCLGVGVALTLRRKLS